MMNPVRYTEEKYNSIYESTNKEMFDLEYMAKAVTISKKRGIVLQSYINKVDTNGVYVLFFYNTKEACVYFNYSSLLRDLSQYIK